MAEKKVEWQQVVTPKSSELWPQLFRTDSNRTPCIMYTANLFGPQQTRWICWVSNCDWWLKRKGLAFILWYHPHHFNLFCAASSEVTN